jgi:hypothetical protein
MGGRDKIRMATARITDNLEVIPKALQIGLSVCTCL